MTNGIHGWKWPSKNPEWLWLMRLWDGGLSSPLSSASLFRFPSFGSKSCSWLWKLPAAAFCAWGILSSYHSSPGSELVAISFHGWFKRRPNDRGSLHTAIHEACQSQKTDHRALSVTLVLDPMFLLQVKGKVDNAVNFRRSRPRLLVRIQW